MFNIKYIWLFITYAVVMTIKSSCYDDTLTWKGHFYFHTLQETEVCCCYLYWYKFKCKFQADKKTNAPSVEKGGEQKMYFKTSLEVTYLWEEHDNYSLLSIFTHLKNCIYHSRYWPTQSVICAGH